MMNGKVFARRKSKAERYPDAIKGSMELLMWLLQTDLLLTFWLFNQVLVCLPLSCLDAHLNSKKHMHYVEMVRNYLF